MPRLERGPGGSFIVHRKGGPPEGELIQGDWNYLPLAEELGWSLLQVQVDKNGKTVRLKKVHREHSKVNCQHQGTDGTVVCPKCRLTPTDFISAASDWLAERAVPQRRR